MSSSLFHGAFSRFRTFVLFNARTHRSTRYHTIASCQIAGTKATYPPVHSTPVHNNNDTQARTLTTCNLLESGNILGSGTTTRANCSINTDSNVILREFRMETNINSPIFISASYSCLKIYRFFAR